MQSRINKPDWFILIEQWKPKGMGERGVTLPFLVGALAKKAEQTDLGAQHVRKVLNDIIKQPVEGYVTEVQWCTGIDAPVFNVCQIDGLYNECIPFKSSFPHPSGIGQSLVFSEDLHSMLNLNCKDAHECFDRLVEYAAAFVSNGKYSKQGKGEYVDFQSDDLDYIRETIMADQIVG